MTTFREATLEAAERNGVLNKDGMWWHEAPKPRRLFHRHRPWTIDTRRGLSRCACGAYRYSDIPGWGKERNPRFRWI